MAVPEVNEGLNNGGDVLRTVTEKEGGTGMDNGAVPVAISGTRPTRPHKLLGLSRPGGYLDLSRPHNDLTTTYNDLSSILVRRGRPVSTQVGQVG